MNADHPNNLEVGMFGPSPKTETCDYCGELLGETFCIRGNYTVCEVCNGLMENKGSN